MAREKLTATRVASLKRPGRYSDGGGLWLQVSGTGAKSWLFQYTALTAIPRHNGRIRQRQHGLGPLHTITLAEAREKALAARKQVLAGIDPIDAHREERKKRRLIGANRLTFQQCAEQAIAARAPEWGNSKHRDQWRNTLAAYVYPSFGNLPVASVETSDVLKALQPTWTVKPETAARVRGRIEIVLDWATAHNFREGPNPARWPGHLDKLLPSPKKLRKVRHHPAMPYQELAEFMQRLRVHQTTAARALEFAILTAARTAEVIGARWTEIDMPKREWTIPSARMKARREHRVPLSEAAMHILDRLPREAENSHVFIGSKAGASLPRNSLLWTMREVAEGGGYVPHGFRSTFRDWAAECTAHPNEVAEMALAHTIRDRTEAAYRRGDLLLKRRCLMEDWAQFCTANSGE